MTGTTEEVYTCPECGAEMWYSEESDAYYCPESCGWEYHK